MLSTTTIARPYAKAIFEYALMQQALSEWSEILEQLVFAVLDERAEHFIANPSVTVAQQTELLMSLFSTVDSEKKAAIERLVALLAENKRLRLLPDIKGLFDFLKAEQEKTLQVKVVSFSELLPAQEARLIDALSRRLQRQVTLDVSIDKSLIGGAIIHAGDLIIDGSVRGKLNKLRTDLAA